MTQAKAQANQVMLVQTGQMISRDQVSAAVQEQLKSAPGDTVIKFTIQPVAFRDEFSRVVDRLSKVAADNDCSGNCD